MVEEKNITKISLIMEKCNRILSKTANVTKEEFANNDDLIEIVCFNIFLIGENVKQLSKAFTKNHNKIPWAEIAKMRDKIGHHYLTIDIDIVWNTINESIPKLNEYCHKIYSK